MLNAPQSPFLSFRDAALEREYRLESAREGVRSFRWVWVATALSMMAFGLSDPVTAGSPDNLRVMLVTRFLLAVPLILGVAALGWAPARTFARFRDAVSGIGCYVMFGTIVLISVGVPRPELMQQNQGFTGLIAMLLAAYMLQMPRFALALAWLVPLSTIIGIAAATSPGLADRAMTIVWVIAANWIGGIGLYALERSRRTAFLASRALETAHERAEALLRNVLPEAIAERLKAAPKRIAERFDDATVLFGDIVGFTQLSQEISAEQLVEALDDVFSAFDDIAQRHGLEKIKTIGDAYMVVGGVPTPRADHVEAVARMALEMAAFVREKRFAGGRRLGMRIGIHTGPVVAGVIGKKKFSYDLWGDTVNTASRMESHGIEGEVQVSDAARSRLGAGFELVARGAVVIKGKGEMQTWLLKSIRAEA